MKIIDTRIEGLKIIELDKSRDARGGFIKVFNRDSYLAAELELDMAESYYTVSQKNVIRGMHFQIPPYDHNKLVHVLEGNVIDVVLDLRKNSKTFLQFADFNLAGEDPKALYIPKGLAHGFKSLQDGSLMLYLVSTVYKPECDKGIYYNSFGYDWGISDPIITDRDKGFVDLQDFVSPF